MSYPDEHVERMHLENDIQIVLSDLIDKAIEEMSLEELRVVKDSLENREESSPFKLQINLKKK